MNRKLFYLLFSLVAILALGAFLNLNYPENVSNPIISVVSPTFRVSPSILISPSAKVLPTPISTQIPDSYLIEDFPFQPQAPFANWDQLHDEACEEMALILAYYYVKSKSINQNIAEDQLQKMVNWEVENWGSHRDLTIKETGNLSKGFYNFSDFEIKNNITIDDIKREISKGHPVIVPTAGRLLGNPYFQSPGPVYHMVVIIGYDDKTIIVQDVGTKRGDHYKYSETVLYNAIHDWTGDADTIGTGQKTMLVFEKN